MSDSSPWKTIQFEDQANALDVDFIDDKNGFLVGSNRLIMESNDGGETWEKRNLDLPSEENFRLLDIDFKGEEGWLIGQPALVMHTFDAGKNKEIAWMETLTWKTFKIVPPGRNFIQSTQIILVKLQANTL